MAKRSPVRGLGIDLPKARAFATDLTGRKIVPSPIKWTGGKGHSHYVGPLRDALRRVGPRRLVDPMVGGANIPLNLVPGGKALLADANPMLIGMHNAIKNKKLELDWSRFMDKEGVIGQKTYYEDLRGGSPKGRKLPNFNARWPPNQGSLNHILHELAEADLTPSEELQAIRLWAMYQNMAWRGIPRMNRKGFANMTMNDQRGFRPTPKWDYKHFSPLMQNFDLHHMPIEQSMHEMELHPKKDILTLDPPYQGELASLAGDEFDLLQKPIADWAGEFAEDGGPVIAFNSPAAQPLYEDAGFDTFIGLRPDMSAAHTTHRRTKPELIAHANIPGMSEEEWYSRFPHLRIGSPSKQLTLDEAFEKSWPTVIR